MAKMQALQPEIKAIQERYGSSRRIPPARR